MLFYEALLEEALTLNDGDKYKPIIQELLVTIRVCQKLFIDGGAAAYPEIGQKLRMARNRHTAAVFDVKEN
jgi:hypothetical protein